MKKAYFILMSAVLTSGLFSASVPAVADSKFIDGLKKTANQTSGAGYAEINNPMQIITGMIGNLFTATFLGITFLGLMLYAGFIWMTARGNEQEVGKAKNIIIYAVIGLTVILAAYAITILAKPLWQQAITTTPE